MKGIFAEVRRPLHEPGEGRHFECLERVRERVRERVSGQVSHERIAEIEL